MTKVVSEAVQREIIKWGFIVVVALLGVGLMSLANRDVYSKEEVDERDRAVLREVNYVQEVQSLQNDHTNEQLGFIRDDMREIKELMKESRND